MSRVTAAGVICRSRAQGGRTGVPNTTTPCSSAGRRLALGVGEELEPQHLLADQKMVAVLEVDGPAQADVDAVAALERRQDPPGQAGHDARVPGRKVRIVEQEIPLGAADVDLVAEQVVGDAVGPVAMDHDQPETDLLLSDPDGRRHRRPTGFVSTIRSVERLEAGGTAATCGPTGSDNGSTPRRVPQNWQKTTSGPLMFPQRPHLVMSKGFASGRILW